MPNLKGLCEAVAPRFGVSDGSAYRFLRACVESDLCLPLEAGPKGRDADLDDMASLLVGLSASGPHQFKLDAITRSKLMTPIGASGKSPFSMLDAVAQQDSFFAAISVLPLAARLVIDASTAENLPDLSPTDEATLRQSCEDGFGLHRITVRIWHNRAAVVLTENGKDIWFCRFAVTSEAAILATRIPQGVDLHTMAEFGLPTLLDAFHAYDPRNLSAPQPKKEIA